MARRMKLKGKVVVVTGAASGIGRALARAFAQRGAQLALVDLDARRLAETAEEMRLFCNSVSTHVLDLADQTALEALPARVLETHGVIDVLVNNAGLTVVGEFEALSAEQIERQLLVNLHAVIHGCRVFLPHLRSRPRAHIVNTSSMAGLVGMPWQSIYCTTKFAIRGFTQSLRAELQGSTVGVTALLPGTTRSRLMLNAEHKHAALTEKLGSILEKRSPKPEGLARRAVRAVEHDKAELFGGLDAPLLDWSHRAFPWFVRWLMGRIGREAQRRQRKNTDSKR